MNTNKENFANPIAHVVKSGDSQTIRLPKEFHLTKGEFEIFRRGNEIVLREHKVGAEEIFDILASFPDDFMAGGRIDTEPQKGITYDRSSVPVGHKHLHLYRQA